MQTECEQEHDVEPTRLVLEQLQTYNEKSNITEQQLSPYADKKKRNPREGTWAEV